MRFLKSIPVILAGAFLFSACSEKPSEAVHQPIYEMSKELQEKDSFKQAVEGLSKRYKAALETGVGSEKPAVFFEGETLSLDEIDRRGGQAHLNTLLKAHNYRKKEIESYIIEKIYESEGKLHGISGEDLLRNVMEAGMSTIKREDFVNGGEVDIQRFESASQEAAMLAHLEFVTKGVEKYNVEILYKTPEVVSALDASQVDLQPLAFGDLTSNVVVEIYMDYECPYCRAVESSIERLYKEYGDKARFEYNLFPIPGHERGRVFGLVGYCAAKQGVFWDYNKTVFRDTGALDGGVFKAKQIATSLGADASEIEDCLNSGEANDAIESFLSKGVGTGVTGTPTVMIAGVPVSGNQEYSEYERVIRAMLGI